MEKRGPGNSGWLSDPLKGCFNVTSNGWDQGESRLESPEKYIFSQHFSGSKIADFSGKSLCVLLVSLPQKGRKNGCESQDSFLAKRKSPKIAFFGQKCKGSSTVFFSVWVVFFVPGFHSFNLFPTFVFKRKKSQHRPFGTVFFH